MFTVLWLEFRFKSFLELHLHFKNFMCISMRKLHEKRQVEADAYGWIRCQIAFSFNVPKFISKYLTTKQLSQMFGWSVRTLAQYILIGITFYWFEAGQKLLRSWSNYFCRTGNANFAEFFVRSRSNYFAHDGQHALREPPFKTISYAYFEQYNKKPVIRFVHSGTFLNSQYFFLLKFSVGEFVRL